MYFWLAKQRPVKLREEEAAAAGERAENMLYMEGPPPGSGFSLTYLTVLSREALWTGTVVLIWLGVHTSSSVNTRLMATAVIQIWSKNSKEMHSEVKWQLKVAKRSTENLWSCLFFTLRYIFNQVERSLILSDKWMFRRNMRIRTSPLRNKSKMTAVSSCNTLQHTHLQTAYWECHFNCFNLPSQFLAMQTPLQPTSTLSCCVWPCHMCLWCFTSTLTRVQRHTAKYELMQVKIMFL